MNKFDFNKTISPFDEVDILDENKVKQSEPEKEIDFDKTISPFDEVVILDENKEPQNEPEKEIDFDKTISPFDEVVIPDENKEPQNEPEKEIDFDKTVSPFEEVYIPDESKASLKEPEKEIDFDKTVSQFNIPDSYQYVQPEIHPNKKAKNSIFASFKLFFKNYTDFSGRTRRSDYWNTVLANIIVSLVFSIVSGLLGAIGAFLLSVYILVTLLPSLAICVRRLHDIGKKGAYLLLGLIPIVGTIVLIVWFTKDSQAGSNEYGESPKYN